MCAVTCLIVFAGAIVLSAETCILLTCRRYTTFLQTKALDLTFFNPSDFTKLVTITKTVFFISLSIPSPIVDSKKKLWTFFTIAFWKIRTVRVHGVCLQSSYSEVVKTSLVKWYKLSILYRDTSHVEHHCKTSCEDRDKLNFLNLCGVDWEKRLKVLLLLVSAREFGYPYPPVTTAARNLGLIVRSTRQMKQVDQRTRFQEL